jgi:hypothetical protein
MRLHHRVRQFILDHLSPRIHSTGIFVFQFCSHQHPPCHQRNNRPFHKEENMINIPDPLESAARERVIKATYRAWVETTTQGKRFFPSKYNCAVLWDSARHTLPISVETLCSAYDRLSHTYDLTVDAAPKPPARAPVLETAEQIQARQAAAAQAILDAEEANKVAAFAEYEQGLPGMNSMQRLQ